MSFEWAAGGWAQEVHSCAESGRKQEARFRLALKSINKVFTNAMNCKMQTKLCGHVNTAKRQHYHAQLDCISVKCIRLLHDRNSCGFASHGVGFKQRALLAWNKGGFISTWHLRIFTEWTAMKLLTDIHSPQETTSDPLTFSLQLQKFATDSTSRWNRQQTSPAAPQSINWSISEH